MSRKHLIALALNYHAIYFPWSDVTPNKYSMVSSCFSVRKHSHPFFFRPLMAHAQGCLVTWTQLQRYLSSILISMFLKLYHLSLSLFLTFDTFSCSHLHLLLSLTTYDLSSNLGSHLFFQYPYVLQSHKTSSLHSVTTTEHRCFKER